MLTYLRFPRVQMAQVMERNPHRTPLGEGHGKDDPLAPRTVPILTPTIQMSGPPDSDPMDITTPTNSAPPSATKSPEGDSNGGLDPMRHSLKSDGQSSAGVMSMAAPPPAAAAAVNGPKIVQTAFIHKLYK